MNEDRSVNVQSLSLLGLKRLSAEPTGDPGADRSALRLILGALDSFDEQFLFHTDGEDTYRMDVWMTGLAPRPAWLAVIRDALRSPPDWWSIAPNLFEEAVTLLIIEWLHLWPETALPVLRDLLGTPETRFFAIKTITTYTVPNDAGYPLTSSIIVLLGESVQQRRFSDEEASWVIEALASSPDEPARALLTSIVQCLDEDSPSARRTIGLLEIDL